MLAYIEKQQAEKAGVSSTYVLFYDPIIDSSNMEVITQQEIEELLIKPSKEEFKTTYILKQPQNKNLMSKHSLANEDYSIKLYS